MTFTMHASAAQLARLFPDLATISDRTITQDAEGTVEETFSPLFVDIPAQFSPLGGADTEVRNATGEFVSAAYLVHLQGDYDIEETSRCTIRGLVLDIVAILRDSYGLVTTLHLEEREP